MDNAAIFLTQSNLNEFNAIGTNARPESIEPITPDRESTPDRQLETEAIPAADSVELSQESLTLSRLESEPFVEETLLTEADVSAELLANPEGQETVAATAPEIIIENTPNLELTDLTAEPEPEPETETIPVSDAERELEAQSIAATTPGEVDVPTAASISPAPGQVGGPGPTPVTGDEFVFTRQDQSPLLEPAETETPEPAAEPAAPETVVETETEAGPPPETEAGAVEEIETSPAETPGTLEFETEQLAQVNAILNNATGLAPAAAAAEIDIAPESPRNEQQTLLQNVGSQMAQAIPPSSIISLLG
jgi:hypothetical protein